MASAAELTLQHRQHQLAVRSAALRDYLRLWPLWQLDQPESFQRLVAAALPLVRAYYQASSVLAGAYYQAHRKALGVPGLPELRLAEPLLAGRVVASLYVTGEVQAGKALAAGMDPEAVRQATLVRTSGALTRHVLTGGRMTLVRSALADGRSGRWRRITGGEGCDFCRMLASRGAVYGAAAVDFQAHDHCSCSAEPEYT